MSDPVTALMARLRQEYLAEVPDRLEELRAGAAAFGAGQPADLPLPTLFHRLAGSAGAYGFGPVSLICRELEGWLAAGPPADETAMARIAEAIRAIEAAFAAGPSTEGIA